MFAVIVPTWRLPIGAALVTASVTIACTAGSGVTVRVTISFVAVLASRCTSPLFVLIFRSRTESSRPKDRLWMTVRSCPAGSGSSQLYWVWVCPLMIASTFADTAALIADSGPLAARLQSFGPFAPTRAVALVDHHDLRLDAEPLQQRRGPVDRGRLVAEREALDAVRRHDRRQVLEGGADDADLHATDDS